MNPEKLKKLQAQVRIGGKGTPRRKKKVICMFRARNWCERVLHFFALRCRPYLSRFSAKMPAERLRHFWPWNASRRERVRILRLVAFLQVVHATAATDDKKLQSCLKKLSVNTIPGIEEVNMIKDDGTVIHFNNPKAQASLSANTFAITGHGENKQITDMLPGILSQLGPEGLTQLKRLASSVASSGVTKTTVEEDDEVPDLVENFDEASKEEVNDETLHWTN